MFISDDYFGLVCSECDLPPLNCHCKTKGMNIDRLVEYRIGVTTNIYFLLMYTIYSGTSEYYLLHIAVFGVN